MVKKSTEVKKSTVDTGLTDPAPGRQGSALGRNGWDSGPRLSAFYAGAQLLGFRTQIFCLLRRGAKALRRGAIYWDENPFFAGICAEAQ
jgi:hypothetical protein